MSACICLTNTIKIHISHQVHEVKVFPTLRYFGGNLIFMKLKRSSLYKKLGVRMLLKCSLSVSGISFEVDLFGFI